MSILTVCMLYNIHSYMNIYLKYLSSVITILFISGCSSYPPPRALPPETTLEEVIQLSQAEIPDHTIISQINASRTVFHLNTEDILRLKEAQVSYAVIDFMLMTEKRAIAARERARYRYYTYDTYYYYHRPYHWDW